MYAELSACMQKLLGHVCGNSSVRVCGFWVHVCGNAWVQSMRLLGACMRKRLGACLTVFALPDNPIYVT